MSRGASSSLTQCVSKALAVALALLSTTASAFGQSPVRLTTKTSVTANGLVAELYTPADAQERLPALIVLGGSRGGLDERTAWEAKTFAEHGYAALHLAYIVGPGLPTALHLIPLEYFKAASDWLRAHPDVDPNRIGIVGTSIGGLAALLVAAHYPEFKVVVSAVPSSVVWSTFSSARTSMFSLAGQPLPYLPYGVIGGSQNLYDDGLNALARHPDAIIPVEQIQGPLMVICGKLDSLWPSCRMSAQSSLAWRLTSSPTHINSWSIQMPGIRCSGRLLHRKALSLPPLETWAAAPSATTPREWIPGRRQ